MSINKTVVGTAVVALVIGIGVGYAGANTLHSSVQQTASRNLISGASGGIFNGTRGGTGRPLSGVIAAKDSGSITVNTNDGSSHVVLITPATDISKSVNGSMSDISIGSVVIVSGTTNSDGSISAKFIQLRPAGISGTVK